MKRRMFAVWLAVLVLLMAGCGGGAGGVTATAGTPASSAPSADMAEGEYWDMDNPMPGEPGSGWEDTGGSIYQNPKAKLIRRAELNIQTEQFDQSRQALNQLVAECGGYFEMANLYGGSRRDVNASRRGEYIIRVPAEQYSRFFNSAGDLGYVTSSTESSEDVGEQYYDTEARLKTQRTKQERLLALLEKAETMEDIISLESALSEVEYQIEQYSSTLNRYDALVSFATFSVTLLEVGQVTQEVGETASLGARMAAGFQSSFRGLVQGGRSLLIWASYNIFLLVILAAVAAAAVFVGKKELKKLQKQDGKKSGEEPGKTLDSAAASTAMIVPKEVIGMEYTIQALSRLSGVTTRALRWYDEIGLLKPSGRTEGGYRLYGPAEVDRLQDILYYRALGVELARVKELLDDPSFDRLAVLRRHLAALEGERARIQGLIDSVKETIRTQERDEIMADEKKFEAFKQNALKEYAQTYEAESRELYGDTEVDGMLGRIKGLTHAQYVEWERLDKEILEKLSAAVAAGADPAGEAGKELTELHRRWLTVTGNKYDTQRHRGLAELYVQDKRFTAYYDRERPGCAQFLRDAVLHWVN